MKLEDLKPDSDCYPSPQTPPLTNREGQSSQKRIIINNSKKKLAKPLHVYIDWLTVTIRSEKNSKDRLKNHFIKNVLGLDYGQESTKMSRNRYSLLGNIFTPSKGITEKVRVIGYYEHGGNADTLCITLRGDAFQYLYTETNSPYKILERFSKDLGKIQHARITRVDLAADDFDGKYYSILKIQRAYNAGKFDVKKKRPELIRRDSNGRNGGKTLEIGSVTASRRFVAYEKGKKEGDLENQKWLRLELKLYSRNKAVIPLEVICNPGRAFADNSYPYLSSLDIATETEDQSVDLKIKYIKKIGEADLHRKLQSLKHSYGHLIGDIIRKKVPLKLFSKSVARYGMKVGPMSNLSKAQIVEVLKTHYNPGDIHK